MDIINTTNPVDDNNAVVVVVDDEADLSNVDVDIERDTLPIRQGTVEDESETLYKRLIWGLDTCNLNRFRTEKDIRDFIKEQSSVNLKYCCDKIEGLFPEPYEKPQTRAKRAASEDHEESFPSKRLRLAISAILQEEIYERDGMPPAAPSDKAGMRREPDTDVVEGDWGMAFRDRREIYYHTFHVAGGVDGAGFSCTQQKAADPDDQIGLVSLFNQFADKDDLLGEEGEELKAQIENDWDKVKIVENKAKQRAQQ